MTFSSGKNIFGTASLRKGFLGLLGVIVVIHLLLLHWNAPIDNQLPADDFQTDSESIQNVELDNTIIPGTSLRYTDIDFNSLSKEAPVQPPDDRKPVYAIINRDDGVSEFIS